MLRRTHKLAGHTEPYKSGRNRILILDYQSGKQIVEIKYLSPSGTRFQTCQKKHLLSANRIRVTHGYNSATDSSGWISAKNNCCNQAALKTRSVLFRELFRVMRLVPQGFHDQTNQRIRSGIRR